MAGSNVDRSNPLSLISPARLTELASTLVAIPSVTGHEHALSDWMAAHLAGLGLAGVQRLPVEEAGDTVIGWIDGPADGPALLLCFHMDTFGVFDGWQTEPFTPTLEGNRLIGLGAHDMKGGAACVLGAVESLLQSSVQLAGRVYVAGTTDEENWSRGAHALIRSGLLKNCIGCLIPEPSNAGTLTVGARGRHVFHLRFHGKTVHAAYGGGVNAAVDAGRVAGLLGESDVFNLGFNEEYAIGGSVCVIGLHSGGTLILMPEVADLYVDRHILPGQGIELAAAQLHDLVARAAIRGHYTLAWDERPTPAPAPYIVAADHPLVQTVRRVLADETGAEIRLVLARSVADTNHFAVHGGIPTLICGPQGGNTCEANEYLLVDSLPTVARTYVRTVLDLLGSAERTGR